VHGHEPIVQQTVVPITIVNNTIVNNNMTTNITNFSPQVQPFNANIPYSNFNVNN